MSQPVAPPVNEPADFSLVLGGPLFQLLRRAHLSGDALQMLRRRLVVLTTLAWVPLLVLSVAEGHGWSGVALPFLHGIEAQVWLLIALPLLILGEIVVHDRMRPVVRQSGQWAVAADTGRLVARVRQRCLDVV